MFLAIPGNPFIEFLVHVLQIPESVFGDEVILDETKEAFDLPSSLGISGSTEDGFYPKTFADVFEM